MPQYEYVCVEDGEMITLLRPMAMADAPVEDPAGRGRRFVRRHSTFAVGGSKPSGSLPMMNGGGCACGDPFGPCNSN